MTEEQQYTQQLLTFRMQLLQAEIEMQAMIAENKRCELQGKPLPYGHEEFTGLVEKHSIHHNAFPFL